MSTKQLLAEAARLYVRHAGRLLPFAILFWLPSNLLDAWMVHRFGDFSREATFASVFTQLLVGAYFAPTALHLLQNEKAGLADALAFGARKWSAVLAAQFIAGLRIGFGLLMLVVPGVLRAIRYSLSDEVVSLEPTRVSTGRVLSRAEELTDGRGVTVFVSFFTSIIGGAVLGIVASMIIEETLGTGVAQTTFDSTITSALHVFTTTLGFAMYRAFAGADPIVPPAEPADDIAPDASLMS